MRKIIIGAGLAAALVLAAAPAAQAADTPTATTTPSAAATATATPTPTASASTSTPTPTAATSTPAPTPTATAPAAGVTSAITIKGRTAGTGTNFSGTYRVQRGGVLVPAQGKTVDLQRKTPTGWTVVEKDAADANGNLVFGTVRSNFVQTWRLVANTGTSDPDYGVSPEFKFAQDGKAVSALTFPTLGFRTGDHVAFNGYFTYRSWWITSGPDMGKQGYVAPLNTRVYLQYLSGRTWKNKTSVLTTDRGDAGVNAYITITTQSPKARTWRLYYPGSATRTSAVSATLTK